MDTEERTFKALGHRVTGTLEAKDLETFQVQSNVQEVSFTTHELTAMCPVTKQPDLYTAHIVFTPAQVSVESKTLKLYLNSFRDMGIFGEDLASLICTDIAIALRPVDLYVELEQQVRGGLVMVARAAYEGAEEAP